jgi:hypothetical protein
MNKKEQSIKNDADKTMESIGIGYLFPPCIPIQKIWYLRNHIQFYNRYFGRHCRELPQKLIPGYKLFLCNLLYRIMDGVIRNHDLLDIHEESSLQQVFNSGKYKTLRELPARTSHGVLVQNIVYIMRLIKKASNWKSLQNAFSKAKNLSENLLNVLMISTIAINNSEKSILSNQILESTIQLDVVNICHRIEEIERCFYDVFRQRQKKEKRI